MTKRPDILFADAVDVLTRTTNPGSRRLNACLAKATRACGDVPFDGTVIHVEVYHLRHFESGSGADWHRHPFTELTLVEGGPVTYEHGAGEISLGEGEYFLMPAFTPHRWQASVGGTALHGFMLTVRPVADRQQSLVPHLPAAAAHLGFHLPVNATTAASLRQAEDEARRGDALSIEAAAGYLRAGLARLFRRIAATVPPDAAHAHEDGSGAMPVALEHAVAFVATHLTEPLDVPTVARHAHLSTRQLDRLFHASFHMPAGAFLLHTRLERARYLLGDSDLSIKQIARACGFADPNYFSRIFRKRHGQSPGAYRRQQ